MGCGVLIILIACVEYFLDVNDFSHTFAVAAHLCIADRYHIGVGDTYFLTYDDALYLCNGISAEIVGKSCVHGGHVEVMHRVAVIFIAHIAEDNASFSIGGLDCDGDVRFVVLNHAFADDEMPFLGVCNAIDLFTIDRCHSLKCYIGLALASENSGLLGAAEIHRTIVNEGDEVVLDREAGSGSG